MPARSQLSPPLVRSLGTVQRTDEDGYGSIATKTAVADGEARRGWGGGGGGGGGGDFRGRTDARRGSAQLGLARRGAVLLWALGG